MRSLRAVSKRWACSAPASDARLALRKLLTEQAVVKPASVFDPLTARMAEDLDYTLIQLAGSVASNTVLAAPDLLLLTMTELAGLCGRITSRTSLPLIVDADNGFGNALGVMRCVEELEKAGVAGLSIEDTVLPGEFASATPSIKGSAGGFSLSDPDEARNRLRAAVLARKDPSMVLIARTSAKVISLDAVCTRVEQYASVSGVDAVHVIGSFEPDELTLLAQAAQGLPIMLSGKASLPDPELAQLGVRVRLTGHAPFLAALQAAYDALSGKDPKPREIDSNLLAKLLRVEQYQEFQKDFLRCAHPATGMK